MTAPDPRAPVRPTLIRELIERQPALALFGAALLTGSVLTLALQLFDHRTLHDVNVWAKPTKFLFSIGVYAITAAWFFGYVRANRRASWPMRYVIWATIAAGVFELLYICIQAARGMDSHFNFTSAFYVAMYLAMGVGAVILVSTTLPLAWEIARRPAAGLRQDYVAAVVLGLVLTFALGGGLGGYMSSTLGHAVGPQSGQFPVFGWNRAGGDYRVAHFFGMHIEQALPLLAACLAPVAPWLRWIALVVGAVAAIALTLFAFVQAARGEAFLGRLF